MMIAIRAQLDSQVAEPACTYTDPVLEDDDA
jgi:hypothetical protein